MALDVAGKVTQEVADSILKKHGPWAFWCAVLAVAFYYFALAPMAHERELMLVTLRENVVEQREVLKSIAASVAVIAASLEEQNKTLGMINKFTEEVSREHPEQSKKLGEILKKLNQVQVGG